MVQTARTDHPPAWVVDELEGHELVPRELQHGEAAELGLRHVPEDLVTEPGVEGERPFQVGYAEADVQRPHPGLPRTMSRISGTAASPRPARAARHRRGRPTARRSNRRRPARCG